MSLHVDRGIGVEDYRDGGISHAVGEQGRKGQGAARPGGEKVSLFCFNFGSFD